MGKVPKLRFEGFEGDWEEKKLGDLTSSFDYGLNASAKEYDGKNKYLRITDIDDESRKFLQDNLTSPDINLIGAEKYKLSKGDVLFARTGASVGKSYIYRESDGLVYFAGFLIRAKTKSCVNPEFVFQNTLTKQYQRFIEITSMRSGQPGVNAQEYSQYTIAVPNKPEQDKTSDLMSLCDHLLTLHQRKHAALLKAKQFYLQNLFPRKGEKTPRLRFAGFSGEWEEKKFGEWGTFYYGYSCPKWSVTPDANVPCVRYGELYTKFGAKISQVYSYTKIPAKHLKLSKGTEVLIPRVGEDPMDYNHCTWLSLEGVAIGEMISVFNSDQDPLFSAMMFNATLQKDFAIRVEGGSVTNLYYDKLMNIAIAYPSLEEQRKIAIFLDNIDHLIATQQRKLETLKRLKQFLLQNLFV